MKALRSLQHVFYLTAIAGTLTTGCKKDKDNNGGNADKTISENVAADNDLTLLEAAIVKAGISTSLAANGNLTLFAPDDAAFKLIDLNGDGIADLDTETKINALDGTNTALLKSFLEYHILTTKVLAADVAAGPNAEVTTKGGKVAFTTRNNTGVYINGVKVKRADVKASNGVIHVIERVLNPPLASVAETIAVNPNFTYLIAASQRAGLDVILALNGPGPLTAFAPTNQAFINAGYPTIASVQAASAANLKILLFNHVVNGRNFSSDLVDGSQLATLGPNKLTVSLAGGAKIKGVGNTTNANITMTNIVATNGVIHVIDQVLLP